MELNNFVVPALLIKAAKNFCGKDNARAYLSAIHLDKNGFIEGTNGRALFRADCNEVTDLEKNLLIVLHGAVPSNGYYAYLTLNKGASVGSIWFSKSSNEPIFVNETLHQVAFTVVDGNYPDISRAFPKEGQANVDHINLSTELIALINKVGRDLKSGWPSVTIKFYKGDMFIIDVNDSNYTAIILLLGMSD